MVTATFLFHGDLNDFLRPGHRHREFGCDCAQSATTKHMVEALGVPHTEVGSLLVNDQSAGFGHVLRPGDRVTVYPVERQKDGQLSGNVEDQHTALRFIADSHLGGLARLLRMAGFNTLYDNNYPDETITAIAQRDHRIVLTRDRELLKRRELQHGCYIRKIIPKEQLREVATRFNLAEAVHPFTLCLHCNTSLHTVDKEAVLEQLPPSVRENQHEFRSCACCHRIYWKGSHWQRMRALLDNILQQSGTD